MERGRRIIGASGGAVGLGALATALGTCCVAPWAVGVLGVTGAVALARLAFLQPYLLAGMVALLALGFWFAYRPAPGVADGSCDPTRARRLRWAVWAATACALAFIAFSFAPRFL